MRVNAADQHEVAEDGEGDAERRRRSHLHHEGCLRHRQNYKDEGDQDDEEARKGRQPVVPSLPDRYLAPPFALRP